MLSQTKRNALKQYELLTKEQKEKLNKISRRIMRRKLAKDRPSPIELIKRVVDENFDKIIEERQELLLKREIKTLSN